MIARRFVVHGRVQGVFYRASCRHEADRLGVRGWARNLADGTVEVHAEGAEDAVEALARWCRDGPPGAVVTDVEVELAEPSGRTGFSTR